MVDYLQPPPDRNGDEIYLFADVLRAKDAEGTPEVEWDRLDRGKVTDYVDAETVRVLWPGHRFEELKSSNLVKYDPPPGRLGGPC